LKAHVKEFSHKSISTDDWKTFLYSFMKEKHGDEKVKLLDGVDWNGWLHTPGMVFVAQL
jgi:leukotriene-A4 hydrolase